MAVMGLTTAVPKDPADPPSDGTVRVDVDGSAERSNQRDTPSRMVAWGALALLSTQPITWLSSFLTTGMLPRTLTAGELGQYSIALTITGLLGAVVSLGMTTSLVRSVAAQPSSARRDGSAALVLLVVLSIVSSVVLTAALLAFGMAQMLGNVLMLALAGMVVATAQGVLSAVLIGQQRHARFTWFNAISALLATVLGLAALVAGGSLADFMAIGLAVSAVVLIIAWRTSELGFDRSALDARRLVILVRDGLPFLGTSIATRLRGDAEVLFLATLLSQQVVGWWAAANRIAAIPVFIPTVIMIPLLPALAQAKADRRSFNQTVRRSLTAVLMLVLPACLGLAAVAPAVPSFFGWAETYQNSVMPIVLLSVTMPLPSVGMVLGSALIAVGKERQWLTATAVVTVISCGLNLFTIPLFDDWIQNGAVGTALARLAAELAMTGSAFVLLPRGTIDRPTAACIGRLLLAGVGLWLVASWLVPVSAILGILGGGLTYLLLVLSLRVVRVSEIRSVHGLLVEAVARRQAPGVAA